LSGDIFKAMLVGQAVTESAAIFALVVSIVLLFTNMGPSIVNIAVVFSAAICMGLGALGAGISSGLPTASACTGIMRQPQIKERLNTNMLIGAAVCQTPAIFTLVVSFLLIFTNFSARPLNPTWAAVLGAGLSSGLGSLGCLLGCGLVAVSSCKGVARQPSMASELTNIMLLGQAVTQTTAIYSLLVSFIMMFKVFEPSDSIAPAAALLGAGICMGIGAIAPGLGEGIIAKKAIEWIGKNKKAALDITRVMLVGQAVTESTGIYSLVVALMLIFII
jgi:F0F1-type ATP synthase membrane subunit c/vacuolar-type H+-ATPase subunit K